MDFDTEGLLSQALKRARRKFRLSRQEAILKTDLMAQLWIAHAALSDRLNEAALPAPDREAGLRCAQSAYIEAINAIREFACAIARKYEQAAGGQPAGWSDTAEADTALFWVGAYASLAERFAGLHPPIGLEYPDEALLMAFEELPNCP